MPGSSEKTILVVEDDNRVSEAVCKYLTKHGFSCVPLQEGKKADKSRITKIEGYYKIYIITHHM